MDTWKPEAELNGDSNIAEVSHDLARERKGLPGLEDGSGEPGATASAAASSLGGGRSPCRSRTNRIQPATETTAAAAISMPSASTNIDCRSIVAEATGREPLRRSNSRWVGCPGSGGVER